jgi:hypothetical protein
LVAELAELTPRAIKELIVGERRPPVRFADELGEVYL